MSTSAKWCFFFVLISFVACDESLIDKAKQEDIAYQETVTINNIPKATLTFFDVQDSRCPEGAQCIVAGNATVDLELNGISVEGRVKRHIIMCLGSCRSVPGRSTQYRQADTLTTTFADQDYRFILKKVLIKPLSDTIANGSLKSLYAIDLKVELLE